MTESLKVGGAIFGGFALGTFFFVGLWWTVRRGVISAQPAFLFLCSMVLRTLVVMAGFYFLSGEDWRNILGSLAGFVLARLFVTRNARFSMQAHALVKLEGAR
jgi:F1F0 ATPase subunit 2